MKSTLFSHSSFLKTWEEIGFARGGWKKGQPRNFTVQLDSGEESGVQFILDKLSKESWVQLLLSRKALKQKGAELDHVHPLSFFIGVLSPSCAYLFQELKNKGGLAFNEFIKGAAESFRDEKKHGNLTEAQIQIFAQKTGKSIHNVRKFVDSNDWKGFIKWL